jgi:hypothetical protein
MTGNEPQPRRRKSRLSDDDMWSVSAQPPAVTERPAAPPARLPASRADARPREGRGHARDLAEARGRKRSRDAAYAWAAAAAKARDREAEFTDELTAALRRGTVPDMLADYIREACDRYGIDPKQLPVQLLEQVGLGE